MLKRFLWFIIAIILFISGTITVYAQQVIFQDDFSNLLTKWQIVHGSGMEWSIDQQHARVTVASQNSIAEIIPRDVYWSSSTKNYSYEFEYTPLSGVDRNISFGYQNAFDWYEMHFINNQYNLVRVKNGLPTLNVFKTYTLENGRTYQMKVIFEDGHIQFFVDQQKIADEVDWSFNQNFGRISLKGTAGLAFPTVVQFGHVVVRPLPSTVEVDLNVPLFKQTDIPWKNDEYDHAASWSTTPTMSRWGCVVTSLSMILQYYGIHQMPGGQQITPGTVNNWLKSQEDGFIDGNLNWIAFTRLTFVLNQTFQTKKLEYIYAAPNVEVVKNEVRNQRPVMVEVPNHFVVADGIPLNDPSVLIRDPFNNYTKLSQYTQTPLSIRTFQPSNTDLSYLLFAHDAKLHIIVRNERKEIIPNVQSFAEKIQDPSNSSTETTPPLQITQVAKPAPGKYYIEITQAQTGPYRLRLYAYDKEANPTLVEQNGTAGPNPTTFLLTYSQTQPSTLLPIIDFAQFRKDLKTARQGAQITRESTYQQLDKMALYADQAAQADKKRYVPVLLKLFTQFAQDIQKQTKANLEQELHAIEALL